MTTQSQDELKAQAKYIVGVLTNPLPSDERDLHKFAEKAIVEIAINQRSAGAREALEEMNKCGSCGESISRDCERCQHLWQT